MGWGNQEVTLGVPRKIRGGVKGKFFSICGEFGKN